MIKTLNLLDEAGLRTAWGIIKNYFATKVHLHIKNDITDLNNIDNSTVNNGGLMSLAQSNKLDSIELNAQENIIEGISVNNISITPNEKVVNIEVPIKVSDLENDSEFTTKEYVDAIDTTLTARIRAELDFRVADVTNLLNRVYSIELVIPDSASTSNTLVVVSWANRKLGDKEDKVNKVISISSSSTDTQYPSAKCVYDKIESVKIPIINMI